MKNGEAERITAILNNPHSSEEEKSKARKQLIILEDEIKADKKKLQSLEKELERMRNNPPVPPSVPFSLPKLKLVDKLILASGLGLVTYLLISKEEKKK